MVRRIRSAKSFVFAGIAAALALLPTANAAVMVEIPLDTMLQQADLVVRGLVLRKGTRVVLEKAGNHGQGKLEPYTHVWIRVDEVVAGQTTDKVVHLREPGGQYEGVQTAVSGTPDYVAGEEVLVFLAKDTDQPGVYRTLQMVQGKYTVLRTDTGERMAVRDLSDVSLAKWRRSRLEVLPAPAQKPVGVAFVKNRARALHLLTPTTKGTSR